MYYEKFDENGVGLGCTNIKPIDMGGIFEIPNELAGKRLRLSGGVVRLETSGEYEAYMAEMTSKSRLYKTISMKDFKLGLEDINMLNTANLYVQNSNDNALKIEWQYSTDVDYDNAIFINLCNNINVSSEQYNTIFEREV